MCCMFEDVNGNVVTQTETHSNYRVAQKRFVYS